MPDWRSEPVKHNDEKSLDAQQREKELQEELAQLYRDRFDLVAQEYSDKIDRMDQELDMLDKRIEAEDYTRRIDAFNRSDTSEALNQQISKRTEEISQLSEEAVKLRKKLSDAIKNGGIKEGSEEWHAMIGEIESVEAAAVDAAQEIRETYDKMFEAIGNKYDNLIGDIEHRINMLNNNMELSYYTSAAKDYAGLIAFYQAEQQKYVDEAAEKQAELDRRVASTDPNERIEKYSAKWYEYQGEINDALESAQQAELNVYKTYEDHFNDIESRYNVALGALDDLNSSLQAGIDWIEARGYMGGADLYNGMIEGERRRIEILTDEREKLQNALDEAIAAGTIIVGSEAWYAAQSAINGVGIRIQEATNKTLDYAKAIRQINWDVFDYAQERIGDITDETEFLVKLLERSDLIDDNGKFTDQGNATIGLHAVNYNVYAEQAQDYADEMMRLNAELAKDPNNTELIERRNELLKSHRDMILAAEDEKDAVRDLVEDAIEKELDALDERIDKYKESLDSAKDLYEYQKRVKDQTKEIASLQKQIAAYSGDTSEENRARMQKLQVSLEEANEQLWETQYDQYISDSKKLLDDLRDDYETTLNMRLDDVDALMNTAIQVANDNATMIGETINTACAGVGTSVSATMAAIWGDGGVAKNAVSTYTNGIATQLTTVGTALDGVKTDVDSIASLGDALSEAITGDNSIASNVASMVDDIRGENGISGNVSAIKELLDDIKSKMGTIGSIPKVESIPPAATTPATTTSGTTTSGTAGTTSGTTGTTDTASKAKTYVVIYDGYHLVPLWSKGPNKGTTNERVNAGNILEYIATEKGADGRRYYKVKYNNKTRWVVAYAGYTTMQPTKANGFARGGFIADAQKAAYRNGDDIVTINTLKKGEAVLTPEQAAMFKKLTVSLPELLGVVDIAENLRSLDKVRTTSSGDVNVGGITVPINIDHVQDYNDFVRQLRDDKTFERMVQTITLDPLVGKSTLTKKKYYN